jgi:DNA-binding response OmpR family regulator
MRLLVIEDAPDIASLLKLAFQMDGYAVDAALSAEEGLAFAAVHAYDVLILDLNLPDGDGLELCRQLRGEHPHLLMIMLTARTSRAAIVAGLDAGADDYLTKPFDYQELQPVLECGDLRLDPAAGSLWQAGRRVALPRKQFRILEYFLRHQGEVVSQETLLEHVWNAEANPFTNTVRVHINALRRALGDTAGQPRYLQTVVGVGYRCADFAQGADLTETLSPNQYASSRNHSLTRRKTMTTRQENAPLADAPTLLIVDDAADVTQLLMVYFHGAGFHTLAAYDGHGALALLQRTTPDAIILDLGLPDMDGLEVCRTIRQTSVVPIVALTNRNSEADRQQGMAAGANAYITKPFNIEEIHAAVRALLP